jgi:hypothetical protein
MLATGCMMRNGDYTAYILISAAITAACDCLNKFPNVSIPRKDSIGARVGLLKAIMETVIQIYRCSSMPEVIGGKVRTLGIRRDGSFDHGSSSL